ncbi:MAG: helix-turn-helix transcriptional regulator [Eubacteriales bacterium]|nr:helix-turn-helix transcriptional regulator [Eubacteriales bacterium]
MNISLDDISNYFFKSKAQIIRIFKKQYKTTPFHYALHSKIRAAMHILTYTDLSVENISYMLAFCSSKHFSKTFRQISGVSPSEYRKTNSKTDNTDK